MRYLVFFISAVFFTGFTHPFYVSICQIDYNQKNESLELSFKIFADDLEKALEAQGIKNLQLGTKREAKEADRYVFTYIKKGFTLTVDGKECALEYLGKEIENDVLWCYIEVKNIKSPKKFTVRNALLTEQFESQANIVHISTGEKKKSLLLNKRENTGTVSFGPSK